MASQVTRAQWVDLKAPSQAADSAYQYDKLSVSANGKNLILHAVKSVTSPFSMSGKFVVSNNYGDTWAEQAAEMSQPSFFFWDGDDLYIKFMGETSLKKSSDFGKTYTVQNADFLSASVATQILPVSGSSWLCIKSGSGLSFDLYQSTDKGVNWDNLGPVSTSANPNFFSTLVAANGNLVSNSVSGASYSEDDGLSWTAGTFPKSVLVSQKNSLSVSAKGDMILFDWAMKALYKSTDHGANWTEVSTNLPSTADRCAFYQNDLICLCTDGSTYKSIDYGATFSQLTAPGAVLPANMFGYFLESDKANIYTGATNKVLRYGDAVGMDNKVDLGPGVSLYPNPAVDVVFVDNLTVGDVIGLVDMHGKTVYQARAVAHNITICTGGFPAGLYFVQVRGRQGMVAHKLFIGTR